MLTGEANFYNCTARQTTRVAILTRESFLELACGNPGTVLGLSRSVVARLSPTVRQIDFALDWVHILSGRALFRQNDRADGTYIVLSGRLRSVIHSGSSNSSNSSSSSNNRRLVDEYARGDMVGLISSATGGPHRVTTVVAARFLYILMILKDNCVSST